MHFWSTHIVVTLGRRILQRGNIDDCRLWRLRACRTRGQTPGSLGVPYGRPCLVDRAPNASVSLCRLLTRNITDPAEPRWTQLPPKLQVEADGGTSRVGY